MLVIGSRIDDRKGSFIIQRQYVDSHVQSAVGFAFCRLLGFELAPAPEGSRPTEARITRRGVPDKIAEPASHSFRSVRAGTGGNTTVRLPFRNTPGKYERG